MTEEKRDSIYSRYRRVLGLNEQCAVLNSVGRGRYFVNCSDQSCPRWVVALMNLIRREERVMITGLTRKSRLRISGDATSSNTWLCLLILSYFHDPFILSSLLYTHSTHNPHYEYCKSYYNTLILNPN
jgi:hypothetical protein